MSTVWFGGTLYDYAITSTGDIARNGSFTAYANVSNPSAPVAATGLIDETGASTGSLVTVRPSGAFRFGAPDGTAMLWVSDGAGGFVKLLPDPTLTYARVVAGVLYGPDGNPITTVGGNDPRLKSVAGVKARLSRLFFGTEDVNGVRTELGSVEKSESKWWGIWKRHPLTGKKYLSFGIRSSDGAVFPFGLSKLLVPEVGELTGDSEAGRYLLFAAEIAAAMGVAKVAPTGQGGQAWDSVTARGGAVPARVTVTGGVIPASGSVACSIYPELRPDIVPVQVVVSGVPCTYTATETTVTPDPDDPGGGSTSYLTGTLTRIGTGTPVRLLRPMPMLRNPTVAVSSGPVPLRNVPLRNGGLILLPGRHDQQRDPGIVIELLREQLAQLTPEARRRSIVCACLPWCAGAQAQPIGSALRPQLDWMNRLLVDNFPRYFVDINAWLQSADTILAITGNAATTQDLADITAGLTPTTFRIQADGVTVDPGHLGPDAVRATLEQFRMHYIANGLGPTPWTF